MSHSDAGRVLLPDAALTEWLAGMSRRADWLGNTTKAAYLFQRRQARCARKRVRVCLHGPQGLRWVEVGRGPVKYTDRGPA